MSTFEHGKQISVRYDPATLTDKDELPSGKLWPPSPSPMYLFTLVELSADNSDVPTGAYSMYVIPEKANWSLVINQDVSAGSPYDPQRNLLRVPMQIGQLSQPTHGVKISFRPCCARRSSKRSG